jgi:hypothetical protein
MSAAWAVDGASCGPFLIEVVGCRISALCHQGLFGGCKSSGKRDIHLHVDRQSIIQIRSGAFGGLADEIRA